MTDALFDRMMPVFLAEADVRLVDMDEALVVLNRDPRHHDARRALSLAAHTIRGSAAMLGLDAVSSQAGWIEDRLAAPDETPVSLLTEAGALLRRRIEALAAAQTTTETAAVSGTVS